MSLSTTGFLIASLTVITAGSAQAENIIAFSSGADPQAVHQPEMLALIMLLGWMMARRRRV